MADEKNRRNLLNDINKAQERYNQLQDIAAKKGQDYSKALEAQENKIKSLANELKKVNSVIQDKLDFYADEERSLKSISSSFSKFTKLQKQSLDITRDITYQMSEPQRDAISNTLSISRDLSDLTVEDTAQIEKRVSELNTQLNLVEQLFGAESEILDVLKKQAEEAKSLSSLSKEEKEIIDLQKQASDKLRQSFQAISETIQTAAMRLLSWKGLLGGALYGAGVFVDKLSEANRELGQVGEGLGNGAGSASLLSFFFKDSVSALKELGSEFGGVEQASLKTQLQTNLIASNMGIGVGEAAKLQGSFARLNGNSTDVAADLIKSSQQFAYQNKIIPSQLMSDLANSTEEFALYGKNGGENILRAAGYAAKLGVNMKTLSGITDGLLDFETSITKELELGAMLGKNINLNRARALAYEGDIEGATKETLKALGGVDAFNRMDYFQKKQTADLLGTSVAELDKMVKYQEQANTLGGKLNIAFDSVTESVKSLGNSFGGKVLKGAGSLLMTASQAGAQFSQMGFDVKGLLTKLPGVNKLLSGAAAAAPTPAAGGGLGKSVGSMGKGLGAGIKGMASGFASFANPATLLGLAAITAAIIGIGFALKVAEPGIRAFGDAVGAIVKSVGEAFVGIIGALGNMFTKISQVATPELALSVLGLAGGFAALTGSLAAFSIVGLAAIPAMAAVGAFAAVGGGEVLNVGGDESLSEYNTQMLSKMDELIQVTKSAKDVYLDREKVTGLVISTSEKNSVNKFSLNNA